MSLLQDKINRYLGFIENGELLDSYPDADGRKVVINIIGQYPLSQEAESFICQAKPIVNSAGISLRFEEYQAA